MTMTAAGNMNWNIENSNVYDVGKFNILLGSHGLGSHVTERLGLFLRGCESIEFYENVFGFSEI